MMVSPRSNQVQTSISLKNRKSTEDLASIRLTLLKTTKSRMMPLEKVLSKRPVVQKILWEMELFVDRSGPS